jgi:hypothetical protein
MSQSTAIPCSLSDVLLQQAQGFVKCNGERDSGEILSGR